MNAGNIARGDRRCQIIQTTRQPGSSGTPEGSQATGTTPPESPRHDLEFSGDDRDPLPPGHPETRPMESECIIQRSAEAEEALRYSLVAMVADASREITSADTARAIRRVQGVEEGSYSVVPFSPEQFIVHCRSRESRDRILAASVVPVIGTGLVLRPWTCLAQANTAALHCKVSLELEGIPAHAWNQDTVAKMLAPFCWVHMVDPASVGKSDLSAFRLTAWTNNPSRIPKTVRLLIAEPEPVLPGNLPPYLRYKDMLRYRVIVHIRSTADFNPQDPSPSPSPPESDDGHDGNPDRHHFSRGAGPRLQGGRDSRSGGGSSTGMTAPAPESPAHAPGTRGEDRLTSANQFWPSKRPSRRKSKSKSKCGGPRQLCCRGSQRRLVLGGMQRRPS